MKEKNKKILIIAAVAIVIVIIAVVCAIRMGGGTKTKVQKVSSVEEIAQKTNIELVSPENAEEVQYGVEGDNVARVDYKKKTFTENVMNFTLKSGSSEEELKFDANAWGTPIIMTVKCSDGLEVEVLSYVAADDAKVMKGNWYDNDLYYLMTTENLTSREDFLQEINSVILENHKSFDEFFTAEEAQDSVPELETEPEE